MLGRSNRNTMLALAGCLSMLVFFASCSPAAQPGSTDSNGTDSGPVGKATMVTTPQTTGTFDPPLTAGGADTVNFQSLYNQLLQASEGSLELQPALATKWNMSPDGMTIEFEMRQGVKFHNGDMVTPEDVVFTVQRFLRMGHPGRTPYLQRILDSVEAQGNAVIFRLKQPDWAFFNEVSGTGYSIVPKRYIEQMGDEGFGKAPVGTGPFKFVSGSKQEYLDMEAVDYEHFLRKPGVKQLRVVIVPEETTRVAMLLTGEADLAQVSHSSLKQLEGDARIKVIRSPDAGGLTLYMFGQEDPQNPLSKVEVRQALSLGFDRAAIAKGIYRGYARPIGVPVWHPASPGFPVWGLEAPYDPEKAKHLLVKAGYPGGKGLQITLHSTEYGATPLWTQVAPVVASEWGKLGIEVKVRVWEFGTGAPMAQFGRFTEPVSIWTHRANGQGPKGDIPFMKRDGLYGIAAGTARGAHPLLADMTDQFDKELDPAKRERLVQKILEYNRDNVVYMPVLLIDNLWGAGPRVLEYTPLLSGQVGNPWTIKVKP